MIENVENPEVKCPRCEGTGESARTRDGYCPVCEGDGTLPLFSFDAYMEGEDFNE